MGNSNTNAKLSASEIDKLKKESGGRLTTDDIKVAHEQWKKAKKISTGTGTDKSLTKEEFVEYLRITKNVDQLDAENAFKIFDTDGNGTVNFDEFVMSLLLKDGPTPEQFAGICMTIYDADGDGYITKEEMKKMGFAKLKVGGQHKDSAAVKEMEKTIDEIFSAIDKDGDNKLTREEIAKAIKERPDIQAML